MRPFHATGENWRGIWFHRDCFEGRPARFYDLAHAGDCAARANACNYIVHFSICIPPDFLGGGSGGGYLGILPRSFGLIWCVKVFAVGYLFAYLQSIIHSTAIEEQELPPLPGISDFWQDILIPCLQLLGLTLFCFGPAMLLEWYIISSENSGLVVFLYDQANASFARKILINLIVDGGDGSVVLVARSNPDGR